MKTALCTVFLLSTTLVATAQEVPVAPLSQETPVREAAVPAPAVVHRAEPTQIEEVRALDAAEETGTVQEQDTNRTLWFVLGALAVAVAILAFTL